MASPAAARRSRSHAGRNGRHGQRRGLASSDEHRIPGGCGRCRSTSNGSTPIAKFIESMSSSVCGRRTACAPERRARTSESRRSCAVTGEMREDGYFTTGGVCTRSMTARIRTTASQRLRSGCRGGSLSDQRSRTGSRGRRSARSMAAAISGSSSRAISSRPSSMRATSP